MQQIIQSNVDFKRHDLIHTGEKPHCNFLANRVGNLRTHILKHTGKKHNISLNLNFKQEDWETSIRAGIAKSHEEARGEAKQM